MKRQTQLKNAVEGLSLFNPRYVTSKFCGFPFNRGNFLLHFQCHFPISENLFKVYQAATHLDEKALFKVNSVCTKTMWILFYFLIGYSFTGKDTIIINFEPVLGTEFNYEFESRVSALGVRQIRLQLDHSSRLCWLFLEPFYAVWEQVDGYFVLTDIMFSLNKLCT